MKPYGLNNKTRFPHKEDCHPPKGWINWWEDIQNLVSRHTMKQKIKKEIKESIMLTQEEEKQLEHLQAKKQRYEDNCVSCIYRNGYKPCYKADNPEVQDWLNERGIYSDLKKCCPEWYDEC